uniref:Uncharacterized protein n=1 Tax=Tetranychus urticae TaxID=32264 RepID=T1KXG4_TETUR
MINTLALTYFFNTFRAHYISFVQTRHSMNQLTQLYHDIDKVEFIVMGGTFMPLPESSIPSVICMMPYLKILAHQSLKQLNLVKKKSQTKCSGITAETRPDYCFNRHLSYMLSYRCKKLDTNKGHTVRAVKDNAMRFLTV